MRQLPRSPHAALILPNLEFKISQKGQKSTYNDWVGLVCYCIMIVSECLCLAAYGSRKAFSQRVLAVALSIVRSFP